MASKQLGLAAIAVLALLTLAGCAGQSATTQDVDAQDASDLSGEQSQAATTTKTPSSLLYGTATGGTYNPSKIVQAGSSTVFPLAEVWAEDFGAHRNFQMTVGGGGSGAGVSGMCNKSLDLGDASRQITASEIATCKKNGVDPKEWKIAIDALSVVVSNQNTFVKDLSVAQLKSIFQEVGYASTWDQIDPSFPAKAIKLCYPDSDSGTYEYFNEAILAKGKPRTGSGVQQSADDNVLVSCLAADANAIGYFGLAYVHENADRVHAVKVAGIEPSADTVNDGSYQPLSRYIYIYTNGAPQGILKDYFSYVLNPDGGQKHVPTVGYVKLDEPTRAAMVAALNG